MTPSRRTAHGRFLMDALTSAAPVADASISCCDRDDLRNFRLDLINRVLQCLELALL
jgi:hypothetical protein